MNKTDLKKPFGIPLLSRMAVCCALAAVTVAVYVQVGGFAFVNCDDPVYVTENAQLAKGLSRETVAWAFATTYANFWHPLTWLSLLLDAELFGTGPRGFHLSALALHVLNSLLLFRALQKLTGALWRSAFAAALFALHPLHVESVAWIAERKDVLSTLFWMLTLIGYAAYVKKPGAFRYIIVLAFFVAGMMAKPMLVTLPCVLLLLDWWPLGRFRAGQKTSLNRAGRLVVEKLPLLMVSAAGCALAFCAQQSGGALSSLGERALGLRVANALVSCAAYCVQALWPAGLALPYRFPAAIPLWRVAGAVLLLSVVTIAAFRTWRRKPFFAVGWLWFLGTLVPVIGLVPVGSYSRADRFTYVPLIGLGIMAAWALPDEWVHSRRGRWFTAAGAGLVLLLLSLVTWKQVGVWRDSETLFANTLRVDPANALAHNNLGLALEARGQFSAAEHHYRAAVEADPAYAKAQVNLGGALMSRGRVSEAVDCFRRALQIAPQLAEAHYNLGLALAKLKRYEEALGQYRAVLRIDPGFARAHNNMGRVLAAQGRFDAAIQSYQSALSIDPAYALAHGNLALALESRGRLDEAIDHCRAALQLQPGYVKVHSRLGRLLARRGKIAGAIRQYQAAIRLRPDYAEALNGLGEILLKLGKRAEASRCFQKALAADHDFTAARQNLSTATQAPPPVPN